MTFESVLRLLENDLGLKTFALDVHKGFIKQQLLDILRQDIEFQIINVVRSQATRFYEQANSLTFESARRLLEKDLGLETFALDIHKRFIKQQLLKCLEGSSKNSGEIVETNASTTAEAAESQDECQSKKEVMESCSEDKEKIKDSCEEIKDVSENEIKEVIRKRASYMVANLDKVTVAGVFRLLEEDMNLDKYTLDTYKKFISKQLAEVLKSHEVSDPASEVKKKLKKDFQSTASRNSCIKESTNSSESENGKEDEDRKEEEEEEERFESEVVPKGMYKNSVRLKKRERPQKETKAPSKKRIKAAEKVSEYGSDAEEEIGVVSEGGRFQSSAAKAVKDFVDSGFTMRSLHENGSHSNCLWQIDELRKECERLRLENQNLASENRQVMEERHDISTFMKLKNEELTRAMELVEKAKREAEKAKEEAAKERHEMSTFINLKKKNEEMARAKELAENAKEEAEKAKEEVERERHEMSAFMKLENEELTRVKEFVEKAKREAEKAKEAQNVAEKSATRFKSKLDDMQQHVADLQRQLDEARASASRAIDEFRASKACQELLVDLAGPYMDGGFDNFRMQAIRDFPKLKQIFEAYELDIDMVIASLTTSGG
ncbi:hypothetical protein SLEP1_g45679 [Rubroshorea leprosula]|uniref:DEK-C domain-containing protein n=1 Tax=Rubroshorea leprosula TaxID=152421 RepID=A0AAV5LJU7_9ROSI|nr:hypothetical protein SLEP1_g45679 [Rubroshorea leprosula]